MPPAAQPDLRCRWSPERSNSLAHTLSHVVLGHLAILMTEEALRVGKAACVAGGLGADVSELEGQGLLRHIPELRMSP